MAEPNTVQERVRKQVHEAENTFRDALQTWNDLTQTTTAWTFNTAEQSLRYGEEVRAQTNQVLLEGFASYRRLYQDALNSWQGYLQRVTTILSRRS